MNQTAKILLNAALWGSCVFSSVSAHSPEGSDFEKFRIGGYGEMLASFKGYGTNRFKSPTGNPYMNRNTIAIPRFVIAGDYKFDNHWQLGAEIEFEAGGTGAAWEQELTENEEYEMEVEKGGEVALEQFHITYSLNRYFNIRAGHMVLPVGLTNAHHEPLFFFGTVRPEGETAIIPSTWHETGLSIFGSVGRGWGRFNYEAYVTAGLNASGFDRDRWAGNAKQGLFEQDNFTSPAYTLRLEYLGVPGLRLGASAYYCANVGANTDKLDYEWVGKIPVFIGSVDAQYTNKYVTARGNCIWGLLDKASELGVANVTIRNGSPYSRKVPIAKKAVSYGGEIGLNIQGFTRCNIPLTPFVRYEYYNPQEDAETLQYSEYTRPSVQEPRLKTNMWVVGMNWRPIPNLVVKADYTARRIGDGKFHHENEFAIGVAYTGWFWTK